MTAAEALPQKVPETDTTVSLGFRLKVGDVPYVLVAKASPQGWQLSATKNGDPARIPGTLTVEGTDAVIVVPWSFFSGAQVFTWTGYLGWNRSGTVQSYAFDIVPNNGEAPYPAP